MAAGKVLREERYDYQGEEPAPLTEEERASLAALLGKIRDSLIQERTEEAPKE